MKTYAKMVLGCKVNDYEATCITNEMDRHFIEVSFNEKADIYLIFTCCVTNVAEAKTRKFFHKARRLNPDGYIVAIGCLSQIKGDTEDFKDVDLIIGSSKKDKAVEMIIEGYKGSQVENRQVFEYENLSVDDYPGKSRAFLKIQDGCNQFCTYCVIPYTRGRERSLDHKEVLNYAKKLENSYEEIVLTGIHTGRYFDGEYHLVDLLKMLLEKTKLKTIRLSSIEMTEVTDEIIELMKNSDGRIAHHLHIPVQAMSDDVLKDMHRPYTIEEFIKRIEYIRIKLPDVAISTDLIVGFPGETDEIFNDSLKNMDKIRFSFIHVFPYSKKEGTVAEKMKNHVHPDTKKARVKTIENTEKKYTLEYNRSFIGKDVEVLIEKTDEEYSYGYSKQYFYVKSKTKLNVGSLYKIRIDEVNESEIIGTYVS